MTSIRDRAFITITNKPAPNEEQEVEQQESIEDEQDEQ